MYSRHFIEDMPRDPFRARVVLEFGNAVEVGVVERDEDFSQRPLEKAEIHQHSAFAQRIAPGPDTYLVIVPMQVFALAVVMHEPVGRRETCFDSHFEHSWNLLLFACTVQESLLRLDSIPIARRMTSSVPRIEFPYPKLADRAFLRIVETIIYQIRYSTLMEAYMKKFILCVLLVFVLAVPSAFGQWRFEIGANAPLSFGMLTGDEEDSVLGLADFSIVEELGIIPIPNLAVFLEADLSILKLGAGIKAWSAFGLANFAYPVLMAELALGPLFVDATVGGLFYGYYTIGNIAGAGAMEYLVPDVSAWVALGKKRALRLGGGLLSIMQMGENMDVIPYIAYAGLKVVL